MSLQNLVYFLLLSLVAEVLGTVGGFGSSMFFVPVASYFLDFHSVLGITAIFHVSSNLSKIFFFRKGYDKKLLLTIGLPAVAFVILGAYLSRYIDARILDIVLAIFLITVSTLLLAFRHFTVSPTLFNSIFGGMLSGIIAGVIGTGGAIRGITLAAFDLKTQVFIATSAIIDLGVDTSRSVVYSLNGYIHRDLLYISVILFFVSIAGTYIGKRILSRVSEEQFKSIVLILIFLTGIATLAKVVLG
jgi:uncharacterized membrane protein YfcA